MGAECEGELSFGLVEGLPVLLGDKAAFNIEP